MKYVKMIFAIAIFCHLKICLAQPQSEIGKAKNVVIQLYKLNTYDHSCHTLLAGKNREDAEKILAKADIYDFPLKAMDLYEFKKKNRNYWLEIFREFYVENIAVIYVDLCDKGIKDSEKRGKYFDDFRFPYNYDENASLIIKRIEFGKVEINQKEMKFPVIVNLKNNNKFSLIYTMKLTSSGWRVFDIIEMTDSATRDNELVVRRALQEEYAERKK